MGTKYATSSVRPFTLWTPPLKTHPLQMVYYRLPRHFVMECAEASEAPRDNFLPPEILEEIVGAVWRSPLHIDERRTFFASASLVSKLWAAVLVRVSARDAFTLSLPSVDFSRHLFQGQALVSSNAAALRDICLTFTYQKPTLNTVFSPAGCWSKDLDLDACNKRSMRDLFATFRLLPFLPNLDTLSVVYVARNKSNCWELLRPTFSGYVRPPQPQSVTFSMRVARLELEYVLAPDADLPEYLIDELGLSSKRADKYLSFPACQMLDLEHVSFPATTTNARPNTGTCPDNGTDQGALGAFLNACPRLQPVTPHDGKIQVRIHRASRPLPPGCAIVHGALQHSTRACERITETRRISQTSRSKSASRGSLPQAAARRVIRGTALGLVYEPPKALCSRDASPSETPILNTWRNVHIFMPRGS